MLPIIQPPSTNKDDTDTGLNLVLLSLYFAESVKINSAHGANLQCGVPRYLIRVTFSNLKNDLLSRQNILGKS